MTSRKIEQTRLSKHQCIRCGAKNKGTVVCRACCVKINTGLRRRRVVWREQGLCHRCGRQPFENFIQCYDCIQSGKKAKRGV